MAAHDQSYSIELGHMTEHNTQMGLCTWDPCDLPCFSTRTKYSSREVPQPVLYCTDSTGCALGLCC